MGSYWYLFQIKNKFNKEWIKIGNLWYELKNASKEKINCAIGGMIKRRAEARRPEMFWMWRIFAWQKQSLNSSWWWKFDWTILASETKGILAFIIALNDIFVEWIMKKDHFFACGVEYHLHLHQFQRELNICPSK